MHGEVSVVVGQVAGTNVGHVGGSRRSRIDG